MKFLSSRPKPVGFVDHVADGIVRGWAWDPADPGRRVPLDFFLDGIFLGQTTTGVLRPDLVANAIGDGRQGFVFHMPDDVRRLGLDPAGVTVVMSGPGLVLERAGDLANQPIAPFTPPRDIMGLFAPYLAAIRAQPMPHATPGDTGERSKIDLLCAPCPEMGRSAFAVHIAHKHGRSGLSDTTFWDWYLETYALEKGPARAPLSAEDILALLSQKRVEEPARRFGERFRGRDVGPHYDWAIEQSRRLFVEDCLVSRHSIESLRDIPSSRDARPFPLSHFMRVLKQRHAILRRLPVATEADRRIIYAAYLLLGLRSPHYLAYMPSRWLQAMLEEKHAASLFETTLRDVFGAANAIDAAHYLALLEASGFDVETQSFSGLRYRGHRVLNGGSLLAGAPSVDVQIIGPFRRKMGLGESCRRIARALRMTRFSVNLVDYDVCLPTAHLETDADLSALRPARLNILHLNGEEIPEAYAYLPDVFSQAPTVAIPYWELNQPVAAHQLGLRGVDQVWAASRYLRDVFDTPAAPAAWIGMSYEIAAGVSRAQGLALRTRYAIAPETFTFLTTSDALSWVQRKNPLGVIEAFHDAFKGSENVALIVKTHNLAGPLSAAQNRLWTTVRELCDSDARIVLIDETLTAEDQRALLAGSDCLVSLHRAEGLGLDLLDAMAMGLPLVATAYSGNLDFCSDETAWMVAYDLKPVGDEDYGFVEPGHVWAEPSHDAAVAAMRDVHADPARRGARAAAGQRFVRAQASPEALSLRLEALIEKLLAKT